MNTIELNQDTHGAWRRSHDCTCNVIVTKLTPLSTPPGAQGVLSQYFSEVYCANYHITFNQNWMKYVSLNIALCKEQKLQQQQQQQQQNQEANGL